MEDEKAMSPSRRARRKRFLRVARCRTTQVLNHLRLLGNCANRCAYDYTPGEVSKMFDAIKQELADAERLFNVGDREKRRGFSFEASDEAEGE